MSTSPIQAITAALDPGVAMDGTSAATRSSPTNQPFSSWLVNKVDKANHDVMQADAAARAFAVDDSIPVHQVTYAMEQARISMEIMLQVRTRLVDAYQELTRMQL